MFYLLHTPVSGDHTARFTFGFTFNIYVPVLQNKAVITPWMSGLIRQYMASQSSTANSNGKWW